MKIKLLGSILLLLLIVSCVDSGESDPQMENEEAYNQEFQAGSEDAIENAENKASDGDKGETTTADGNNTTAKEGETENGREQGVTGDDAEKDIIDTAVEAGSFRTLAAALSAANLVDALKAEGPFTVFAPTDEAFAALGSTVDELLNPENVDQLTELLTYHVLAGDQAIYSTDLRDGALVPTLAGSVIAIDLSQEEPKINDATVTIADIAASNGIIHVIDKVLLPPENIVSIAGGNEDFESLVATVSAAGLVETLQGPGPFTVFAPTNEAFAALGTTLADLLRPEAKDDLASILTYHVINGLAGPLDLQDGAEITTVNGAPAMVRIDDEGIFIGDAQIIATNIVASNGVIHVIDKVILPPTEENSAGTPQSTAAPKGGTENALQTLADIFLCSINPETCPQIETVPYVDIERYMGLWYQISAYETPYSGGLEGVTAEYTLKSDGSVQVYNKGYDGSLDGPVQDITGTAVVRNEDTNAELKVSFPGVPDLNYNNYLIIILEAEDYSYAVVSDPFRTSVFVLSRTTQMDPETYDSILSELTEKGFDTSKLVETQQPIS